MTADVNYNAVQISMPYQHFESVKKRNDQLQAEIAELKKKSGPEPGSVEADLRIALYAALPVVQFAVGNLTPESVRGWPHKELERLSRYLNSVADEPRLVELGTAFKRFAEKCVDIDGFREERVSDAKDLFGLDEGTKPPA